MSALLLVLLSSLHGLLTIVGYYTSLRNGEPVVVTGCCIRGRCGLLVVPISFARAIAAVGRSAPSVVGIIISLGGVVGELVVVGVTLVRVGVWWDGGGVLVLWCGLWTWWCVGAAAPH